MSTSSSCPSCTIKGKSVGLNTVRSLCAKPEALAVLLDEDPEYRFCAVHDCPVVYYPCAPSAPVLELKDVRVRVGQKEPGAPTPICYCFDYTAEDILEQLQETGSTEIPGAIQAEIKAGNCTCETSNPQGSCCMGNVRAVVRKFQEAKA